MPKKTNFTANGSKYFRVTATIGKNSDGSTVRRQFYGSSKKEAEDKRDEFLTGLKQGLPINYQQNVFGKVFKHWLESVHRPSIGLSSYKRYEGVYRLYIADCGLAGMRLIDIKAANIQGLYNSLLSKTNANNIRNIHKLLQIFFNYCVKADILIKNPLLAVELPSVQKPTTKNTALSDADIEKLVNVCKWDISNFPYLFVAFTGLRAGELLALTYRDIDLVGDMIDVNKSVKYLTVDGEYKPILSETKTTASNRRVPILDEIKPLLDAHIHHVRQSSKVLSISGDFILFPSATGTYRDSGNFLKTYKRLCVKLGIENGHTIHSLRHTFCTILARQGVSLLDASRLMGHSNINTTAEIYSHVSESDKKIAVKKLSTYFN